MNEILRDTIRDMAVRSAQVSGVVNQASELSLFAKTNAIEACKNNPYQPAIVWHPTGYGSYMQLDLRERVAQEIFLTGGFEPDILWFFSCIVDPGMIALDGGAHIGFFTLALAHLVGPSGHVDAFEPIASTKAHLDTNVTSSGMKHIHTHPLALWSRSEVITLNDWGHAFSAFNGIAPARVAPGTNLPQANRLSVPATSIDAFVKSTSRAPDVVKIDVESAESAVIDGMSELLATKRPVLVLEVGDFDAVADQSGAGSTRATLEKLIAHNYALLTLSGCRLARHERLLESSYSYGNMIAAPAEHVDALLARTGSA